MAKTPEPTPIPYTSPLTAGELSTILDSVPHKTRVLGINTIIKGPGGFILRASKPGGDPNAPVPRKKPGPKPAAAAAKATPRRKRANAKVEGR